MISGKDYHEWCKKQPCVIAQKKSSDPHHLFAVGMGRTYERPKWEHFTVVPMAHKYHVEVEFIGVDTFQKKYKINLYKEALRLLSKYCFEFEEKLAMPDL